MMKRGWIVLLTVLVFTGISGTPSQAFNQPPLNLGLTDIDAATLEIEIEDLSNNLINTCPEGETVPYIRIFGLDRFDEYGIPGPDNRIDLQAGLIDFNRGLLTFPSLRSFDPHIDEVERWTAGDDSFVVPEDYVNLNLANPTIYDDYLTGTDLQNARRRKYTGPCQKAG